MAPVNKYLKYVEAEEKPANKYDKYRAANDGGAFSGVLKPGSAAPTGGVPALLERPADPGFYDRAAETKRRDRRAMARLGALTENLLVENEQGQLEPELSANYDIGKFTVASPIHAERAAVGAAEATANFPGDVARTVGVPYAAAFDPEMSALMSHAETGMPGVGVDPAAQPARFAGIMDKGGYNELQAKLDAAPRFDFSGAKIPVPEQLQSMTGQFAEPLMQFLFARGLIGKMGKGGGLIPQLGKDAAAITAGFDADTPRLSEDLAKEFAQSVGLGFLSERGDNPLFERIKNGIEDLLISGPMVAPQVAVRGVQAGYNGLKALTGPRITSRTGGAPQPAPVPSGTPQAPTGAQAGPQVAASIPATVPPPAAGAGPAAPLPGNLRPLNGPGSPLGMASRSFNAMSPKGREAALRALTTSGMKRDEALAAIRSLDDLPPERQSNYEFELLRRYGGQFPDLEANLAAMGRKWANDSPNRRQIFGGRDGTRQVMNDEVRAQINSEGKFVTETAERNFGPGVVPANQALDEELDFLSQTYEKLLSTKRSPTGRLRSQAKKDAVMAARDDLSNYLRDPALMQTIPEWVKKEILLQASDDLRRLKFTPEEKALILQGDGKVLAPLFEPNAPVSWSPQLWDHLARQYPTQAAHSLQSAYRQAGDLARTRGDVASITDASMLQRLRGGDGGSGVLDRLERAVPGYRENRLKYGDRKSAQRAIQLLEDFKRAAANEGDVAEIIRDLKDLPARHREMAENQITSLVRQEVLRKIDSPKPSELGQADRPLTPNLTALSKADFLKALEDVFGDRGRELAEAIRWARSSTDNLTGIHPKYQSRTTTNTRDVENAEGLYEDPFTQPRNILDIPAGVAGAGGAMAAFIPGGQAAAIAGLSLAAAKGLWNAYKAGKKLSNAEKTQLAEFFFKSRQASPDAEDLARIPGPRGPSPVGYVGNVAVGAGVGAGAAAASGNDPVQGAAIGALGGGARAGMRARRAGSSIIPPRGTNGLLPPPSSGSPPVRAGMFPAGTPEMAGGVAGGTYGATAPLQDMDGDGDKDATDRHLMIGSYGMGGMAGVAGIRAGVNGLRGGRVAAPRGPAQSTFAGVNARTADKKLLGIAEQMEKAGAGREQIWKETGWFKGADGKWRFEIDDSKSGFNAATRKEFEDYNGHVSIGKGPDGVFLKTAFNHAAANRAYPGHGYIGVRGKIKPGAASRGSFTGSPYSNQAGRTMGILAPDLEEGRSVVLHEGQHAVQDIENYARGGMPETAWGVREKPLLDEVRAQKKAALGGRDPYALQNRIAAGYHVPQEDIDALSKWRKLTEQEDEILDGTLSPQEAYRRLAGEVEARNVQTRRDFTPDERRAKPPWTTEDVPEDQQIVRFGSGRAESRPPKGPPPPIGPEGGPKLSVVPSSAPEPKPSTPLTGGARPEEAAIEQGGGWENNWHHSGKFAGKFNPKKGELGLHIGDERSARGAGRPEFIRATKGKASLDEQPTPTPLQVRGKFAEAPDLMDFGDPFNYRKLRYENDMIGDFDPKFEPMWKELDAAAKRAENSLTPRQTWRKAVHEAARKHGVSGWQYVNEAEGFGSNSRVVFFEDAVQNPTPPPTVRPPPAKASFGGMGGAKPTNGLTAPVKKAKSTLSPVVQETLRDVDRMAIERLLEKRKNASAANIPEIDAQVAALLKRNQKPQKAPPPILSKEVRDFDKQIADAERRFTASRRKFGRFPDQREPIYQAHIDEIADLKRQRAEALARDQLGKGVKKFARQAYNAGPKIVAGAGLGAAAGVIGATGGMAAYNGLTAPPRKKDDSQPQGRIAPPEDTRYRDNPVRNSRNRELVQQVQAQLNALGWLLETDGIMLGSDGLHGAQTETQKAVRRFQYENDLPVSGLLDSDTIDAIGVAFREQLNRRASEARSPRAAYQEAR